jgi:hypothetical protein
MLEQIAKQLCGINENDMQKAELNIAKILVNAGVLQRVEKNWVTYELANTEKGKGWTYKQLAERILAMPAEAQENNVSILLMDSDEVMPMLDFVDDDWAATDVPDEQDSDYFARGINQVAGVLDDGHPYITVAF